MIVFFYFLLSYFFKYFIRFYLMDRVFDCIMTVDGKA